MTLRKRRFEIWTAILILGTPVLYVLSFGPACWWLPHRPTTTRGDLEIVPVAPKIYWPIGALAQQYVKRTGHPDFFFKFIGWYATLGTEAICVPTNSTDTTGHDAVWFSTDRMNFRPADWFNEVSSVENERTYGEVEASCDPSRSTFPNRRSLKRKWEQEITEATEKRQQKSAVFPLRSL
jgi:hypothetical protein